MGLEIRKGRDGKLIEHWFGRYTDEKGERICKALTTTIDGIPPASLSLRDMGDQLFEDSRKSALKELAGFKIDAQKKGRAIHLTEDLIEAKTGRRWTETPIDDLPSFTQTMKGKRSKDWQTWQVDVIRRFAEWAKERGLRSVLEVTPELAETYIEKLGEPDDTGRTKTPKTIRHMKSIFSLVFGRVLPAGVENPFKNIRVETPDGGEMEHRKPLNALEVDRLLKDAKADPFVFPLIVTALSTGLRRGDVCCLKWSGVNLKSGTLTIKTAKTGAAVTLPIMETLRGVLAEALAEREEGAVYVFPAAERMLRENPDGITYRVKKVFALAFAKQQDATLVDADAPERVTLANVLPDVLKAVQAAKMTPAKREKLTDLLTEYADGKSYRDIQARRTISRGAISGLLHEAEALVGVRFLPDTGARGDSVKSSIRAVTRRGRSIGMRDASKYDFHALRTTFVTLAIGGKNPMPVEKVIALTGHKTVETAMKFYFKPEGSDYKNELEAAMPQSLTGRKGARKALPEADLVATMAAQLQNMTAADRARLAKLLDGVGK